MSRDIRSFFAISKKGSGNPKVSESSSPSTSKDNPPVVSKKRKQNIILDSDESSDDDFADSLKKVKHTKSPSPAKKKEVPKKTSLVPVANVADILGTKPAKRSLIATLPEQEEPPVPPKKSKKDKRKGKEAKKKAGSDSDFEIEQLDELDALEKKFAKTESSGQRATSKTNGDHPKSPVVDKKKSSKSSPETTSKYFRSSSKKSETQSHSKNSPNKPKGSPSKTPEKSAKETRSSPKKESHRSPKKESHRSPEKTSGKPKTPSSHKKHHQESDGDVVDSTPDASEKKKSNYWQYMQRSGPAHPGSKEIPEGVPNCLQGLTFVVTGVLDSLDREECADLIKGYGGKCTSSVSKNTSYIVAGNEPGPSKMEKAEKLGTPIVDEDGFLDLIRTRVPSTASPSSSTSKTQKGKGTTSKPQTKPQLPVVKSPKKEKIISPSKPDPDSVRRSAKAVKKETTSQSPPKVKKTEAPTNSSRPSSRSVDAKKSPTKPAPSTSVADSSSTSSQPSSAGGTSADMWVDKYKPSSVKNIIGQQGDRSCAVKLKIWLSSWTKNNAPSAPKKPKAAPWAKGSDNGAEFKAVLLSGPPGIGKTTTAQLVCKELGFDIVEFNASDTRSKKLLQSEVKELLSTQTLTGFLKGPSSGPAVSSKRVLLMEEVDGVAGNQDRGGIQELIQLIKSSRIPIICTCNDRSAQKLRSLVNYCFDLRFPKPRVEQIRGAMKTLCFKEKVTIPTEALDAIIEGTNHDIRQVIHHLSLWSAGQTNMDKELAKKEAHKSRKEIKLGPWDVVRKVFSDTETKGMSINERAALFFHDYSMGPLFVQENYLLAWPRGEDRGLGVPRGKVSLRDRLRRVADAADSIATGDLIDNALRGNNAWALLPTQAIFASVVPGTLLRGQLSGMARFPSWLGRNSKKNKFDRILSELQMHMRLSISGSKEAVALDYLTAVRNKITRPVMEQGIDGISESIESMDEYHLLREDLDNMNELCNWGTEKADPWDKLPAQTKAAFTRAYNKANFMTPYSITGAGVKGGRRRGGNGDEDMGEFGEEGEEGDSEEEEDADDITTDKMIKQPKKTSAAAASKAAKASTSKASTGAKGGGGKGRGRGRGK